MRINMKQYIKDKKITVCSKCLRASCWQAIFFCNEYKEAGTVEKTIKELLELNLEHSDYFMGKLI